MLCFPLCEELEAMGRFIRFPVNPHDTSCPFSLSQGSSLPQCTARSSQTSTSKQQAYSGHKGPQAADTRATPTHTHTCQQPTQDLQMPLPPRPISSVSWLAGWLSNCWFKTPLGSSWVKSEAVPLLRGRERPKTEAATPDWQVAGLINKGTYT